MKNLFLYILFFLLSNKLFSDEIPPFSFLKATPEGGVTYNSIKCIAEDENGFIWFGSNDGLFKYNSNNIKRYSYSQHDTSTLPTNRVNSIYKDLTGRLWVGTENGLCYYNSKDDNFTTLQMSDQFDNSTGKIINSFFQTEDGVYWFADEKGVATIGADYKQAFYFNINNKREQISKISLDSNGTVWVFYRDGDIYYKLESLDTFHLFSKGLPNLIRSVLIDEENIWIAYHAMGLLCLNMDGSTRVHFNSEKKGKNFLPDNQVRSLVKDEHGRIWAGTYKGIAIIEDYRVATVINQQKYSVLPDNSIWSLHKDSQQNIWVGTYRGGLCFHSKFNKPFFHYNRSTPQSALSYNLVSSFIEVPGKDEIIVGTEDGVLNYFNIETNEFRHLKVEYDGIKVGTIKSLEYDKSGTLWIGTYGHGLLYQKKYENTFNKFTPPFREALQALDLLATADGLWVSNYPMGVYFYDFDTKKFRSYRHSKSNRESISDDNVRKILEDRNGNIWFATRNGLNKLAYGSNKFQRYFYEENSEKRNSNHIIYTIHEDNDGNIWIGTNGEGLYKINPDTNVEEHYTVNDGLPGNEIFSILQDQENNLWFATKQGLSSLNPKLKTFRTFNNAKGIKNNHFNPNAAIQTSRGIFYYGGTNGFIQFHPQMMPTNPTPPSTTITNLYINNKEVLPADDNEILDDVIDNTQVLHLNYLQNSFSFRFAANNYVNAEQNQFKYRLRKFNNEWTEINNNEKAIFTKVPPGQYIFEVKAANNDGIWNDNPTQISIHITPPIWKTWYANLFYITVIILNALFFIRLFSNRQKLKHEIEKEKLKSDAEHQVHQMKLQFLTDISHEFKTPLTLINGPIDRLLKSGSDGTLSGKQLSLINRNTKRLIRLTNQIIDFKKIESGKLEINAVKSDVIAFCRGVFDCFQEQATDQSIDYRFKSDVETLEIDFDPDKLDKILFNLLSNAFKYSKGDSKIVFQIRNNQKSDAPVKGDEFSIGDSLTDEFIEISVCDSGKGIPYEALPLIFERFYVVKDFAHQGTGIGLSLTKDYILLHRGQIRVTSKEKEGSVFQIIIPKQQSGAKKPTENDFQIEELQHHGYYEPFTKVSENVLTKGKANIRNNDALVLIVEDNQDLLNYLSDLLQSYFRIAKASNGKQAYEQVHTLFPDIVISDIMMPEMDGIELCKKIKDDIRISHIPVVLLTALDTVKDRIESLNSGADAYVPKPFDDFLLLFQIDNLLESRKNMRESFGSNNKNIEETSGVFDLDKKFLLSAIKLVESNLSNENFTIEIMAEKLNFSRTHLHRKLKSLTNQSATEFVRYIRLKNAVMLMKEGKYKVNEIGYAVGFNSHNYFTKSFKKQYGLAPCEFIREKLKKGVDV